MTPSSGSHAPVRPRRPDHSSLLTSSRTAGSKSLRLVLAMAMVAMMSLVGQATLPRELQSSAQAAGPVTSSLSLFTLTSTVSPTTLPAGGGNLTVTYTVKNISSDTIWYSRDNNSLCVTSQTGMTASTYYRGDYYMRPGQTATFTCTGYVSQTKDIKATFDFVTPRGTRSTATVTDKVTIGTVINNLPGCDTPWYSSFMAGTGSSIGTVNPTTRTTAPTYTIKPFTSYAYDNGTYYTSMTVVGSSGMAIDPTNPRFAYFSGRNLLGAQRRPVLRRALPDRPDHRRDHFRWL